MTERSSSDHLIERAAQRLREANDDVAAVLLNPLPAAPFSAEGRADAPSLANGRHHPSDTARGEHVGRPAGSPDPAPGHPANAPALDAETLERAGMIDWGQNRERLSEEFRIVQGQVLQAIAAKQAKPPSLGNLIMLTSARPGEGKTFTSLNLAGSLASCGQQPVILVDVDIKRHSLTSGLRLQSRPGLLSLASEPGLDFADCLIGTPLPNLRIMPIGRTAVQENAVSGKPVISVLDRLGRRYSDALIILDTPPCLSSSEPSNLAPVVGHIVMLVEAQQTQRTEVEAALDLIDACPSVVLMLNKIQLTGSDTFGAYGY